jgi:hypothetical protein
VGVRINLGLLAGGTGNDLKFENEAREADLAYLLLNGVCRLSPEMYSLDLDRRLSVFKGSDKLNSEKAAEIIAALFDMKVSGGEAYETSLVIAAKRQLGLDVEISQPLRGCDLNGIDFGSRSNTLCEWSIAVGLAMKKLNLQDGGTNQYERN